MRPAQKAPENGPTTIPPGRSRASFNEAGAKSAGKHVVHDEAARAAGRASMRPAQKAPENASGGAMTSLANYASMRPAQKAPENKVITLHEKKNLI